MNREAQSRRVLAELAKIAELDMQLIETEYALAAELEHEARSNKRTLLMSGPLREKLKRIRLQRSNYRNTMSQRVSRAQSYDIVLSNRKIKQLDAELELEAIQQDIVQFVASIGILGINNPQYRTRYEELQLIMKRAKTKLQGRKNAVNNWLAKEPLKTKVAAKDLNDAQFVINEHKFENRAVNTAATRKREKIAPLAPLVPRVPLATNTPSGAQKVNLSPEYLALFGIVLPDAEAPQMEADLQNNSDTSIEFKPHSLDDELDEMHKRKYDVPVIDI